MRRFAKASTPPQPETLPMPEPAAPSAPAVRPASAAGLIGDPIVAQALLAVWNGDPAVVVESPPGAGKTRLVVHTAEQLHRRAGLNVAIAAQTRAQCVDVANRCAAIGGHVTLIGKKGGERPRGLSSTVLFIDSKPELVSGVVVATTARWSWLDNLRADVLIGDEAWQMTYADLGLLGGLSDQVLLVGDPGQIPPVVTGATARWEHSPTGPHRPAPEALIAAHRDMVTRLQLPHTWRLGPETTALIQPAFYPALPFTSKRPDRFVSRAGARLAELTAIGVDAPAGPDDPAIALACAHRVRDLLSNGQVTDEQGHRRPLGPDDIAVIAPHVGQTSALQAHLSDLPEIFVGTINQAQGLEREAVVAVHPLAGYRETNRAALDTGRLCVALSRHRSHASVIIDRQSPDMVRAAAAADPDSAALIAHRTILDALQP